jgi:hypothetical protein
VAVAIVAAGVNAIHFLVAGILYQDSGGRLVGDFCFFQIMILVGGCMYVCMYVEKQEESKEQPPKKEAYAKRGSSDETRSNE